MTPTLVLCTRNARPEKGWEGNSQTILHASRTRTIKLWLSDARSAGQAIQPSLTRPPPLRDSWRCVSRLAQSTIRKQSVCGSRDFVVAHVCNLSSVQSD